jgi:putative flippase GtrA
VSKVEAARRPSLLAHVIFVRYVVFAVVSSFCNLVAQEMIVQTVPMAPLMASVLLGTGVGFFVKYLLEKRWVFLDGYEGHRAEIRKIVIYGLSGVATTLLFWSAELGAWSTWQTVEAKYVGAALGLGFGNWVKYRLDRRYVFARTSA